MSGNERDTKTALVTGTSAGIGRIIAENLLKSGWKVVGIDLQNATIDHESFRPIKIDLTSDAAWENGLAAEFSSYGGVRAIVHAAGFMKTASLGELNTKDGLAMWQIHVAAVTRIVNALSSQIHKGGRIVLLGSRISGGASGRSQYAAVKAALVGLARSWASELISRGITVNVVSPAATETGMLVAASRASERPIVPPLGRYIEPGEVAACVAFLLSEDSGAITGQQIVICGGASL
jgi:3-oxoacyl-[acyl-carrier protein] reductase